VKFIGVTVGEGEGEGGVSLQHIFCLGIDFWLLSSGKIFSERSNDVKAEKNDKLSLYWIQNGGI
jgi:hypothetical protein